MFFCLHYFPIKEAIKIPILLSNRVKLHTLRGKIIIKSDKIIPFMIKIGFGDVGIFDKYYIRSIWQNEGEVIFMGKASIGHGSKLSIGKNGQLVLGDNFKITSNSSIICTKKISIGMGCLISWDVLIMDTDFHKIFINSVFVNKDSEIIIGEKVWICCRVLILKGSYIPNGNIIASNTTINKKYTEEFVLLAGNPASIIRHNILWEQ
jgi:acetyltransferase-like isoleucine patch superfamily enzyme